MQWTTTCWIDHRPTLASAAGRATRSSRVSPRIAKASFSPPAAFRRAGTHNERGKITVDSYLKAAADHLDHHIKFIHDKRAHMGKEMW
jgi:hypothetical protein